MGWTSYNANYYKNGKVDIKKEVEDYFERNNTETRYYKVLKTSVVGSTVYLAVETHNSNNEKIVFAGVFLTRTNMKDYYNFAYKDMDETVGPCYYDCPASILKLLSPTDSEYANEWRKACWKRIEEKKAKRKDPNSLSNLPVGSTIEIKSLKDSSMVVELQKINHRSYKRPIWIDKLNWIRYPEKIIENIGYKVI